MQEGSNENTAYWTRQNCWKLGKNISIIFGRVTLLLTGFFFPIQHVRTNLDLSTTSMGYISKLVGTRIRGRYIYQAPRASAILFFPPSFLLPFFLA